MCVRTLCLIAMVCGVASHISSSSKDHQENGDEDLSVSDHRFFLHEIFTKYGHNGQMTFEGFEHLLESLGLGNILITDHDVVAHQEVEFVHDNHDHDKKSNQNNNTGEIEQISSSQHEHRHRHQNSLPTTSAETVNSTSIYHYKLGEVQIPELLVNISNLVEQHHEMEKTAEIIIEQCLSPKEILAAFGINQTTSLNPVSFLHLCPAIIYELDQGHCIYPEKVQNTWKNIASINQWVYATCAVVVISLCGLFSVLVIPIMQKWFYHTLLQFLVGLAIGSLSGDALLHLMPHAMLGDDSSHDHNAAVRQELAELAAVWRGFAALAGIFFFFVAERVLNNYAVRRSRKKLKRKKIMALPNQNVGEKLSEYRKSSYNFELNEKDVIDKLNGNSFSSRKGSIESLSALELDFERRPSVTLELSDMEQQPDYIIASAKHGHNHSHEVPDSVSAVAWMVIMGDGLHNFCDGLAIGAAFTSGLESGLSTAVAVFCHELPHELGDFAMLLKTGMKVRQALFYNGLSSVLCFVGMVIGVCLGNVDSAINWVFAATAGMFLYIALVDMLPELSSADDENSTSSYQLAIQILGISCGISIMLLIANYEQELKSIIS